MQCARLCVLSFFTSVIRNELGGFHLTSFEEGSSSCVCVCVCSFLSRVKGAWARFEGTRGCFFRRCKKGLAVCACVSVFMNSVKGACVEIIRVK